MPKVALDPFVWLAFLILGWAFCQILAAIVVVVWTFVPMVARPVCRILGHSFCNGHGGGYRCCSRCKAIERL